MFGDTVTILTAATKTDPYTGDPETDWTQPPTETPETGEVQPLSSNEAVLTSGTVVSRWKCFLEEDTSATPVKRVRHRGTDYEIDGKVEPWLVDGVVMHHECFLKLVEG